MEKGAVSKGSVGGSAGQLVCIVYGFQHIGRVKVHASKVRGGTAITPGATAVSAVGAAGARGRWTDSQAIAWHQAQPCLVGPNHAGTTVIDKLEMWQAATRDPERIDYDHGLARGIGMNTMWGGGLHDQLWQQDPVVFGQRIAAFRAMANWPRRRSGSTRCFVPMACRIVGGRPI